MDAACQFVIFCQSEGLSSSTRDLVPIVQVGHRVPTPVPDGRKTLYFSKLNSNRPKPVKRPQNWASSDHQVEVFAQLCCVASDVSRVLLTSSRGTVVGSLGWPDLDSLQTSFGPLDPEAVQPMPGERIDILAKNKHLCFEFSTTYIGLDEVGRWVLAAPASIDSSERRSTPRFQPRGWKVVLRRLGTMGEDVVARVVDLSVGGLAMVVPQDGYQLKPDQPQVGVLLGPTGERLPLRASICHYRPWESSTTPKLHIGATFDGFGVVNHARLARLLASRRT